MNENPPSSTVWEDKLTWFKSSPQYRILDTIDGEPMEFEWNIFPGFTTLQLVDKVQEFKYKMGYPAQFQGRIIFMSMFNDIIWWTTDNEKECESSAQLVSLHAKRFSPGRWSFLRLRSEKKWCSTHEYNPQGEWDRVAEQMVLTFSESKHPVFRSTSLLSRGTLKIKGGGKLSIHFCADERTIELFFRTWSSLRFVWGIQCLSNKNGETRVGRTIWPIVRASKIIGNDTYTFDWNPCTRKFIVKVQGTGSHNKIEW